MNRHDYHNTYIKYSTVCALMSVGRKALEMTKSQLFCSSVQYSNFLHGKSIKIDKITSLRDFHNSLLFVNVPVAPDPSATLIAPKKKNVFHSTLFTFISRINSRRLTHRLMLVYKGYVMFIAIFIATCSEPVVRWLWATCLFRLNLIIALSLQSSCEVIVSLLHVNCTFVARWLYKCCVAIVLWWLYICCMVIVRLYKCCVVILQVLCGDCTSVLWWLHKCCKAIVQVSYDDYTSAVWCP